MSCVEHQHFVLFKSLNSFNQTKFYVTQFIFNQIKSNFKSNFSFIRLIFTTICHNRPIGRFIVVASSVLLILFYIDLYLFVTIMFCVSAASSTGQVLLRPFFMWLCGQRSRQELIELPWIGSVSTLDGLCTGNARPPHLFPSRITTPNHRSPLLPSPSPLPSPTR